MISSAAEVGPSSGALQAAVSRMPGSIPSGRLEGDQWARPPTRWKGRALSGFPLAATLPFSKRRSPAGTLSRAAAMRAILSLTFSAARAAALAEAGENRLE